jgi:hypothetical protein
MVPRRSPRSRDGFLRRIATLIPVCESCRMMASSSFDEGASTGDGELMERGCGARGGHACGTGDVRAGLGRILRRGDGPNVPGSLDQVRPPPLRAVAIGWLKGGASGPRAKAPRRGEAGCGRDARAPTPSPRTGSAEVEVEKRRGGRRRRRLEKRNVSGAFPAPATPFAFRRRTRRRMG